MTEKQVILVAEDDPGLNRLISFKLQKEGYQVISAFDGKEALNTALNENISAITLDIMMPFLDGIQVLKKVRAVKPDLPVVVLSVKSRENDLHQALELGANAYMTKPFQPEQLVEKLKQVLGSS
ncbi:MAG: response regulator transcription factor [Bacillota bacterium]